MSHVAHSKAASNKFVQAAAGLVTAVYGVVAPAVAQTSKVVRTVATPALKRTSIAAAAAVTKTVAAAAPLAHAEARGLTNQPRVLMLIAAAVMSVLCLGANDELAPLYASRYDMPPPLSAGGSLLLLSGDALTPFGSAHISTVALLAEEAAEEAAERAVVMAEAAEREVEKEVKFVAAAAENEVKFVAAAAESAAAQVTNVTSLVTSNARESLTSTAAAARESITSSAAVARESLTSTAAAARESITSTAAAARESLTSTVHSLSTVVGANRSDAPLPSRRELAQSLLEYLPRHPTAGAGVSQSEAAQPQEPLEPSAGPSAVAALHWAPGLVPLGFPMLYLLLGLPNTFRLSVLLCLLALASLPALRAASAFAASDNPRATALSWLGVATSADAELPPFVLELGRAISARLTRWQEDPEVSAWLAVFRAAAACLQIESIAALATEELQRDAGRLIGLGLALSGLALAATPSLAQAIFPGAAEVSSPLRALLVHLSWMPHMVLAMLQLVVWGIVGCGILDDEEHPDDDEDGGEGEADGLDRDAERGL